MKNYQQLYVRVVQLDKLDVICTSGDLKVGEFDNDDIWG